jgi:predicted dienelactone hydrolase
MYPRPTFSRTTAVVSVLIAALAPPAHAAAASLTAGEAARTATTPSAAARNHGDATLPILVWYPATAAETEFDMGPPGHPIFLTGRVAAGAPFADEARHPLILMSHGFGGVARQMTWLGAPLARHGYIVVAVDHPGTNGRDGVTAEGASAPWERAGDLTAALNLVLADAALSPHIDTSRIGVAGFSMGGFTAALEAGARPDFDHFRMFCKSSERDAICDPQLEFPQKFNPGEILAQPEMRDIAARQANDFRDPRIKAAFLIAPALGQALDQPSLSRIHIPVEIVLGAADPIAPPKTNGEFLAHVIPAARLTVLPGVGHYDFLSECGPAGTRLAKPLCTDGIGTIRAQTHTTTLTEAIAFFDRTLGQAR